MPGKETARGCNAMRCVILSYFIVGNQHNRENAGNRSQSGAVYPYRDKRAIMRFIPAIQCRSR